MIAVGRCRAVWRRPGRLLGGEKRFTAAGKGDSSRRRELLLVVARWRMLDRMMGGVTISNCSSSDFSLVSFTRVGVLGGGDKLLDLGADFVPDEEVISQTRGVSGVTVSSDTSRV
jgi:hypothetical protein